MWSGVVALSDLSGAQHVQEGTSVTSVKQEEVGSAFTFFKSLVQIEHLSLKIQNLKYSQIPNFLRKDMTPQMENSTSKSTCYSQNADALKHCLRLPLDYMYEVHMEHKSISPVDLGPILKISHHLYVNTPKSELLLVSKHFREGMLNLYMNSCIT